MTTEPPAAAAPAADPALQLRARLLDLSAFLRTTRTGLDTHRQAIASFERYDNHSAYAHALASLLEGIEHSIDYAFREVARAGQSLAQDAYKAALLVCPPLDPPPASGTGPMP